VARLAGERSSDAELAREYGEHRNALPREHDAESLSHEAWVDLLALEARGETVRSGGRC
jgi:hypothetical protein